jgi:hypothetical protein
MDHPRATFIGTVITRLRHLESATNAEGEVAPTDGAGIGSPGMVVNAPLGWNACPQAAAWHQPRRGLLFQSLAVGFAKMPTSALAPALPIKQPED